jgi:Tfp pilus assembly protein PilV
LKQKNCSKTVRTRKQRRESGFTLLELAIATLVLMVGIVGVVQLVPASQQSNLNNRVDTTAMVSAQREMDQIIDQPLTLATFTDKDGRTINLGSTTVTNTVYGGPAIMQGTVASIDFSATPVANYNYTFTDPNDPAGASYQMRWAVISNVTGGVVVSKRFIVGCQRNGGTQFRGPAIVDTLVQK